MKAKKQTEKVSNLNKIVTLEQEIKKLELKLADIKKEKTLEERVFQLEQMIEAEKNRSTGMKITVTGCLLAHYICNQPHYPCTRQHSDWNIQPYPTYPYQPIMWGVTGGNTSDGSNLIIGATSGLATTGFVSEKGLVTYTKDQS